jgi:DNA-binding NarL/FixJ family response regulator
MDEVLERVPVKVVGKATSLEDGRQFVEQLQPDLIIVETSMSADGAADGLQWLSTVLEQSPQLKAIVLSDSNDPLDVHRALQAGATAYVVKKAHPDDLAVAVRQTFEHSIYLRSSTAIDEIETTELPLDHPSLTRRELEILQLVAEGLSNAKLARMLWVTEQTVKFHLSNIYRKLNVSNRTEASRWAQVNRILQDATRANGHPYALAGAGQST